MALKGVFFDLYGTLLVYGDMSSAWSAWFTSLSDCFEESGIRVEPAVLEQRCEGFFTRPEPIAQRDGLTVYENRLLALYSEFGGTPRADQIEQTARRTVSAWQRYVQPDPEAAPLLTDLSRRMSLGLISNFDHPPHVRQVLSDTGLSSYFDTVIVSADVGVKKPNPQIFSVALDRVGLSAADVAFVGDAPEDIEGAIAAGLLPICIQRDPRRSYQQTSDYHRPAAPVALDRLPPHLAIRRLHDLPDLIAREMA